MTSTGIKITPSREIDILRQLIDMAASELDLATVLSDIVHIAQDLAQADAVFIYMFDEKQKNLLLKSSTHTNAREIEAITLKIGEGITGWVAKQNTPVSIPKEAYNDSRFKGFDLLPEDKYEAFLSVPIIYKSRAIGVINVQHRKEMHHSKSLVNLLTKIARQIGGVIENARLYDDAKKKLNQFNGLMKVSRTVVSDQYLDEILSLIVVVTAELLNSQICSVMLLDEKGENLIIRATESLSEYYKNKPPVKVAGSLSGEVLKSKKAISVGDVKEEKRFAFREMAVKEGLSSMLSVPMIIKQKAIGIINVYTKAPHKFTDEEIDVMQIIAHQAAISVENTKLMEEAVQARGALETRKIIERAKGILMKVQGLSEEDAHKAIHRKSMDSCRSMKEIAEAVILASEINSSGTKKSA